MNKTTLKLFLKDCVSSLSLKKLRKYRLSTEYPSYEAAFEDADGYEDEILTKIIIGKGKKFAKELAENKEVDLMSLRTFIGISSAINSNTLKMIDFGGAAGTHYYLAKSIISQDVAIDWRVVETAQMVKEAKEQGLETDELSFYDSIDSATQDEHFDLVFASSSIHYTPNPYEILKELVNIKANKLVVTRTPITDKTIVLLQRSSLSANGTGAIPKEWAIQDKVISYPATMLEKNKVEDIFKLFGDITLKIREDKAAYASLSSTYNMWGYVVSKQIQDNE